MRKKLFTLLLALVASAGSLFAESGTCGDNLTWDLTDGVLTISGAGPMTSYSYEVKAPWYDYRSSIKTVNVGNSVTSIGNYAFNNCSGLTSVTISNSVTSIGDYAFFYCNVLTSVTIPNSITSIGDNAFSFCRGLTSVTIPNSIISIGNSVFASCSGLTSVTIPNSVISIGDNAFNFCRGLTSVTIPNSVTSIGNSAFSGCSSLTSFTIPNSVTNIGESAFSDCRGLTSVNIPNSVTNIGEGVFRGCSGLTSVMIPNSVTSIGNYAFSDCSGLTSVTIPNSVTDIGNYAFSSCTGLTSVTIPNSVTSIGDHAFYNCIGLTSVTIPNSVTNIGGSPFCGCRGLTSPVYNAHVFAYMPTSYSGTYTIPDGIESIVGFDDCTGLTSVTIPNSVTSIGGGAFSGCSGLTSVTIPNSVTSIGFVAFGNCSSLTSVTIPNSVTSIGNHAFYNCSSLTSVIIPNSVTSIGTSAFAGCSSLTSVTIPNSVTSIGEWAFECCSLASITCEAVTPPTLGGYRVFNNVDKSIPLYVPWQSIDLYKSANWGDFTNILPIPGTEPCITASGTCGAQGDNLTWELSCDGVLTISGTGAMANYSQYISSTKPWKSLSSSIKSVVIGDGVTSIGNYAFTSCGSLTSVTIPNSVTSIGDCAFYSCSSLTSVTIPNGVTRIGEGTFNYCSRLSSVTIPNSVTIIGKESFHSCTRLTSITIPNSVTSIGESAFNYCNSLKSVTIPNSVTSIGLSAFRACSSLTSITIGNSVTSIGNFAFQECDNLTSVNISDIVAWCAISFGSSPLWYAHNLYLNDKLVTDLVIPNGVTSIGEYAFNRCSCLTSVTIPNSVTSIGNYAFNMCSSLKSIYPHSTTPPTIESSTFKNINNDAKVYLTFGTGQLGEYTKAAYWNELNFYPFMAQDQYVSATSYKAIFDIEDIILQSCGISGGEQQSGNVLEYIGLEPNSEYNDVPIVLTSNNSETETVNVSFTTPALDLTTKPSKAVSSTTAILLAETNMSDAEVNCGFEYKRNDAPADMDGTKVFCPVASGQMAGRLKNLKDDVYYKYRAFYQSAAGNMFYGDWQYIFTGDVAVEFDPILYTYGATVVRENEATISGYALAGSEDFTEQGFEYWAESRTNSGANAPHRVPAALNEHFFVQASGIALRATLTNLDAGTVYKYRVYGKVGDQYYYGAEQSFATQGEYEGDDSEAIEEVPSDQVQSTKFLRNGQIFILRGEKEYTLTGQEVR